MIFLIVITLIIANIIKWLFKRWKSFKILKEAGIPGPEPNFWLGNVNANDKFNYFRINEWQQKYGNIFGYYISDVPFIITTDLELIKKIQIKDFHLFMNRPLIFGDIDDDFLENMVIFARDNHWKKLRTLIRQGMSSSKIKNMIPLMEASINFSMSKIECIAKNKEKVNICELFREMTLSIVARTSFGINIHENEKFLKCSENLFEVRSNIANLLCLLFPKSKLIKFLIRNITNIFLTDKIGDLSRLTNSVIFTRKQLSFKRKDILQELIDVTLTNEEYKLMSTESESDRETSNISSSSNLLSTSNKDNRSEQKSLALSNDEVVATAVALLIAGHETTATALSFLSSLLINNPDVQDKVRSEIKEYLHTNNNTIDYSGLSSLPYLTAVINEALRLYPPVSLFILRESLTDYKYNNIIIPKNSVVVVPVDVLHHDSKYWPEPYKFIPERFLNNEIDSTIFQPFGDGPRNCLGMRLALFVVKLIITHLLMKYRLVPCEDTEKVCEIGDNYVTLKPKNGVICKIEKIK